MYLSYAEICSYFPFPINYSHDPHNALMIPYHMEHVALAQFQE